jgi:GNAT superfamily N-acetyltransferase
MSIQRSVIRITQLDDVEEAREIHALAFPDDFWVGDDHTYWVATDNKGTVGFCSIREVTEGNWFLSRAAVAKRVAGRGLQRRMIKLRVKFAIERGANRVYTYTILKGYESMVNLLRCNFRFYESSWQGPNVHYLELRIT